MTDWDQQWRENRDAFNHWPNEELVRWASTLERGSRVLEVGCGSGANLRALESFGMKVWGVDVAEPAVLAAGTASLQVKLGSAIELSFPSESFDAVCDVQCFQHLPTEDLTLAYREAVRVLRRGGRFFQVSLEKGQEHFPELAFNLYAGCSPWVKGAGLVVLDDGWTERYRRHRLYRYRVVEAERVE